MTLGDPKLPLNHPIFYTLRRLSYFRVWHFRFSVPASRQQTVRERGVVRVTSTHLTNFRFYTLLNVSGIAEARVVKSCVIVGNIKC